MARVISRGFVAAALAVALAGPALSATRQHAAVSAPVAHDGPFGIAIGERLSDLGPLEKLGDGLYRVAHPPRTNSEFTFVGIMAFPDTGVCMVMAEGPKVGMDPKGLVTREAVDRAVGALVSKYGQFEKKVDFCNQASVCDDYWVEQLQDGAARYEYWWDFSSAPRADDIAKVRVGVDADNAVTSHMAISYIGAKNREACVAAANRSSASGL